MHKRYYIVLILALILTMFFDFEYFYERRQFYYLNLLILLLLFYVSHKERKTFLFKPLRYVSIFIFFSCLYSHFFNRQPIIGVLQLTASYWGLLSFYLPLHYRLSSNDVSKLLKIISIIFCICYLVQWVIYPNIIFAGVDSFVDGQYRARMACSICAYLLVFWGINDYLLSHKIKYLAITLLGVIPAFIMGFRSLLGMTLLFVIIMAAFLSMRRKNIIYTIAVFSVLFFTLSQNPIVQEKINDMMERQETDNFQNEDYIRFASFAFYETEFQPNIIERIVGGGIPMINPQIGPLTRNNAYQKTVYNAYSSGLYWNDLGIIGLSNMIGIPAVLLIVYIIIKTCIRCKNDKLQFIRYTLLTVLLSSIMTSQELYRSGNFVIIGIMLYYVYIYNLENKNHLLCK